MSLRVCQCTRTLVDFEETFNIQFRTHQNEDKTEGFIVDIPIGRLSVSAKLHFFKSRLSDCLGWIVLLLSLHDALLILRLGLGTKRHLVRFRRALRFGLKRQLPEINSWFWSPSFATETPGNISWWCDSVSSCRLAASLGVTAPLPSTSCCDTWLIIIIMIIIVRMSTLDITAVAEMLTTHIISWQLGSSQLLLICTIHTTCFPPEYLMLDPAGADHPDAADVSEFDNASDGEKKRGYFFPLKPKGCSHRTDSMLAPRASTASSNTFTQTNKQKP